jgi:hypothetical protein
VHGRVGVQATVDAPARGGPTALQSPRRPLCEYSLMLVRPTTLATRLAKPPHERRARAGLTSHAGGTSGSEEALQHGDRGAAVANGRVSVGTSCRIGARPRERFR